MVEVSSLCLSHRTVVKPKRDYEAVAVVGAVPCKLGFAISHICQGVGFGQTGQCWRRARYEAARSIALGWSRSPVSRGNTDPALADYCQMNPILMLPELCWGRGWKIHINIYAEFLNVKNTKCQKAHLRTRSSFYEPWNFTGGNLLKIGGVGRVGLLFLVNHSISTTSHCFVD